MKSIELDLAYDEQEQKPVVQPQSIAEAEDYYGNSFSYDASILKKKMKLQVYLLFDCLEQITGVKQIDSGDSQQEESNQGKYIY